MICDIYKKTKKLLKLKNIAFCQVIAKETNRYGGNS